MPASTTNKRDAARALLRRRPGGDQHQVGGVAVGDEGLRAVESPAVALADCGRPQRGEIGSARRLGHRQRGDQLTPAEARQPALLLLLGAQVDQIGRDAVGVDADAGRVGDGELRQLLRQDRGEPRITDVAATVGLWHVEPEQLLAPELQPHLSAELVVGDVLLLLRAQLAVHEGPAACPGTPRGRHRRWSAASPGLSRSWSLLPASRYADQPSAERAPERSFPGTRSADRSQSRTASIAKVMSTLLPMRTLPPSSGMLKVTP